MIHDGESVSAYPAASVPAGSVCTAETRTCSSGVLSGSAEHETCTVDLPPPPTGKLRLVGALTVFVSPQGSDTTGDGTRSNPWATPSHAYYAVKGAYDLGGATVTIKLLPGTFHDSVQTDGPMFGQGAGPGSIVFEGDLINPGSVVVQPTDGYCFSGINGASFTLRGLTLDGSQTPDTLLVVGPSSSVLVEFVAFGNSNADHVTVYGGGVLAYGNSYWINGSAHTHLDVQSGGTVYFNTNGEPGYVVVWLSNGPTFSSAFVSIASYSSVNMQAIAWNGQAHGTRYIVTDSSTLDIGGSSVDQVPGDAAGVTSGGGQVLSAPFDLDAWPDTYPPDGQVWVTPSVVEPGGTVSVMWEAHHTAKNAATCWVGGPSGAFTAMPDDATTIRSWFIAFGQKQTQALNADATFQLHCLAVNGTPFDSSPVTVHVGTPPAPQLLPRNVLSADTTFYLSPTGDDANGDGTAAHPWATPSSAYYTLQRSYHLAGHTVTLKLAPGTYNDSMQAYGPLVGQRPNDPTGLVFEGDVSNPSSVMMNPASGFSFGGAYNVAFTVRGFKLIGWKGTISNGIEVGVGDEIGIGMHAVISVANVVFTQAGNGFNHLTAAFDGQVYFDGDYTIEGGGGHHGQAHLDIANQSNVHYRTNPDGSPIHVQLNGEPVFDAGFLYVASNAVVNAIGTLWNGVAHGLQFVSEGNAQIHAGSSGGLLPGDVTGTTRTGGSVD
jgi:hypothetical protein